MDADMQHWIEVLGAALIGLGGWLYAVGRKYQSLKEALKQLGMEDANMARDIERLDRRLGNEVEKLEQRIAAVDTERSENASELYKRLDEIGRDQAAQGAQIAHIMDTCTRTNQMLMNMLAGRRAGGLRADDPPAIS